MSKKKKKLTLLYSDKPVTTRVISEHKWPCVSLCFSLEQAFALRGTLPKVTDGKGGQPQASPAIRGFFRRVVLLSLPLHHPSATPRPGAASSHACKEGKGEGLCSRNQTRKECKTPTAPETPLRKGEVSFCSTHSLSGVREPGVNAWLYSLCLGDLC